MIIMMTMHTAAHIIVLWLSSWQDYDYNDNVYDLYFDKMMIRIITDDRIMIFRMTMIINITTTGCWSWSWWQTLTPVEPPLITMVVSQLWPPGCTRWPLLYSLDAFLSEREISLWSDKTICLPLWELLLPTLMVDRVVSCRCGHNIHQIEGSVWKQTASLPVVTLITAECISRQVKRPQAIKWQRPFVKHWSAEVFFSGKRSKVWVFLKWPAREIKIQSCIRYCDVEDKVKISG